MKAMRMAGMTLVLWGLAGGLCAGLCTAKPPTDEEVGFAIQFFEVQVRDLRRDDAGAYAKARRDAAAQALDSLSVKELTAAQMETLAGARLFQTAGRGDQASARLRTLAAEPTIEGAWAAVARLEFVPPVGSSPAAEPASKAEAARTAQREALGAALSHPAMSAAVASGRGAALFEAMAASIDLDVVKALAPQILAVADHLSPAFPTDKLPALASFYDTLVRAGDSVDARKRELLRVRLADLTRTGAAGVDASNEAGATLHKRLKRAENFLDGAYARGDLVGHHAPEINFTWSNAAKPLASLADLRGKVVVLDFWATWCGPCVSSFPDVAKLAAHYEGYPVVVLGVTSLQGYHIQRPDGIKGATSRIETKDDPDKELALMPEFVKQTGMTWTVAFGKEDVFNPDYGVRGIPHVAIIDPKGIVRYRGIHPSSRVTPMADKVAKIDGLLKEFRLPTPPPLEEASGVRKK